MTYRQELLEGVKVLVKYVSPSAKAQADVIWMLEEGAAVIQLGAIAVKARAQGEWTGQAKSSARVLLVLKEALTSRTAPLVPIQFDQGRLHIGSYSFDASWDPNPERPISLPIGATLMTILGLRYRHTETEISRAGLLNLLREAESKRNTLIAKATKILAPLEISRGDLFSLLDERLKGEETPRSQLE